MRTNNFFKSIVTVALSAVISMGAFAQSTTAHVASVDNTAANEGTDYVTKGAEVPYQISSTLQIWDLIAQGVLVPSVYNWSIGAGPTIYKSDGTTAATTVAGLLGTENFPAAGAGFYVDTLIYIKYPATGALVLSVHERTVSNVAGIAGCLDAVGWTQNIQVTNRPSVVFNSPTANVGGCGVAGVAYNIPLTVSGSNNPIVTYGIDYTSTAGAVTHTVPAGTTVNDAGFVAPTGWTALSVDNPVTNVAIPFTPAAGNYGKYVVTVTAITDRISRKSLDKAIAGAQDPGDVVLSGPATLTIYAYPTPTTGKIKHVTNLGW